MFIFESRQASAELREQREVDLVINALEKKGYLPILRHMLAAVANGISVKQNLLPVDILTERRRSTLVISTTGDLLFRDEHAFLIQPVNRRLQVWEIRHHICASTINEFCQDVEDSIRSMLDGRRVRGMNFTWRTIKDKMFRRYSIGERYYQEVKLDTKPAEYTQEEAVASRMFLQPNARIFLLRLAQVGKARASDIASESDKLLINDLLKHNLIRKEFLILCRKDSHTICTVQNPLEIIEASGGSLNCAVCGRLLKDELIEEIYALSENGRKLITGSRWMSIWVTEILLSSCGLEKDKILWNVVVGGDELDIMTDALGPRVFFELKDREFGLGDAYPFAYRVSRYGGRYGVIVTTDKVADEAKKFFEEQSKDMRGGIIPLEGVIAAEERMPQMIDHFSRTGILQLLRQLTETWAIDPTPILTAWMDKTANATKK